MKIQSSACHIEDTNSKMVYRSPAGRWTPAHDGIGYLGMLGKEKYRKKKKKFGSWEPPLENFDITS